MQFQNVALDLANAFDQMFTSPIAFSLNVLTKIIKQNASIACQEQGSRG